MGRPPQCNCLCGITTTTTTTSSLPPGFYNCFSLNPGYCYHRAQDDVIYTFNFANSVDPFIFNYEYWSSVSDRYYNGCEVCINSNQLVQAQCSIPQNPISGTSYCNNVTYYSCNGTNILHIQDVPSTWIYSLKSPTGGSFVNRYSIFGYLCCGFYGWYGYGWGWSNFLLDADCACIRVGTNTGVSLRYKNCENQWEYLSLTPGIDNTYNYTNICMKINNWASFIASIRNFSTTRMCNLFTSIGLGVCYDYSSLVFDGDLEILSGNAQFIFTGVCEWKEPFKSILTNCYGTVSCSESPGTTTTTTLAPPPTTTTLAPPPTTTTTTSGPTSPPPPPI